MNEVPMGVNNDFRGQVIPDLGEHACQVQITSWRTTGPCHEKNSLFFDQFLLEPHQVECLLSQHGQPLPSPR